MNIVLIGKYNTSSILAGPDKVAKRLFHFLSEKEISLVFLTYFFKDHSSSHIYNRLFGEEILSVEPKIIRMGILRIISYLFTKKPNIIHVITFDRFILPILFLKRFIKPKFVYTVHGIVRDEMHNKYQKSYSFSTIKDKYLENKLFKSSDSLVFLSKQSKTHADNYYSLNHSRIFIIPNGISSNFFVQNKSAVVSDSLKIIFYNGIEDNIERGLTNLIDFLDKSQLEIDLFVIGRHEEIRANNIAVHFLNPMNETSLVAFFRDKQIFLNSTFHSSFSLMSLEAMAAGLVVIVSDQTGLSEYIDHGVNGFIYKSKDLSSLEMILSDIKLGLIETEMIRMNAQKFCSKFRWEEVSAGYIDLYKNLISVK